MAGGGKRAGSRRAARPTRSGGGRLRLLGLAVAITVLVLAWAYLVYAAIDFGRRIRSGDHHAWVFLVTTSVGAVACLFVGLMLVVRLVEVVRTERPERPTRPEGPAGGKRAKR